MMTTCKLFFLDRARTACRSSSSTKLASRLRASGIIGFSSTCIFSSPSTVPEASPMEDSMTRLLLWRFFFCKRVTSGKQQGQVIEKQTDFWLLKFNVVLLEVVGDFNVL